MDSTNKESRAMSKQTTTSQSAETPSTDDTALMTRLGLLLGEHRSSTVKTQTHVHPVLSHYNHNNNVCYPSNERRKKSHYTTSPASTLSDKGIGSSVGSFDSEFRNNLSALTETGICTNRTGSLDSRTYTDIVSHSRSDSGIPNHSRSSSEILYTDKISDVSKPRLAEQTEEKLWNADPRRNSGNTQTLPPPEPRPRKLSTGKSRKVGDKSTDSSRERVKADVMKLPQLCLDSSANSKEPSVHSSVSSSRSITPAASVCEIPNYKQMNRSLSSHSNGTAIFDSEPLPPPPPPPPAQDYYGDYSMLPPPPPPPPVMYDDVGSNHSRASSNDRTLLNEDLHNQYREENNNFLNPNRIVGKPPIGRPQQLPPPPVHPRQHSYPILHETSGQNMVQMLRASSGMIRNTPSPLDNPRLALQAHQWPRYSDNDIMRNQLASSMSSIELDRRSDHVSHSRQSSSNSSYAGNTTHLWDDTRPHSMSAPPVNPAMHGLAHRPSASFDNSGFHRRSASRSSNRSNEMKKPLSNASSASDMRSVRFTPCRQSDVNLQALHFELPSVIATEKKFIGREWLFGEIINSLNTANSKLNKGVIIYGNDGTGKTAIIHYLESFSYNGTKKLNTNVSNSTLSKHEQEIVQRVGSLVTSRSASPRPQRHAMGHSNSSSRTASPSIGATANKQPGSRNGSQTSLSGEEAQKRLVSQVVAYHYCQADNNTTCYVPEFLHSVAAQLAQAPQLTAYRELLVENPQLQTLLSLRNCVQNPDHSFVKAVLEPLIKLRQDHNIPRLNYIILLDGLGEAEQHRPDHGHSIFTFLQRHLPNFPDFLKIVATCRTQDKELLQELPLFELSLDYEENNKANITRDIQSYIYYRISHSKELSNLTLMGKPDTATTQKLLATHLLEKCDGNMLYVRKILDLIENGKLVPKSSGFKVIPVNLSEVFLLMCNLKFTTTSSFTRVRDIIAIALASLYPLKDEEIYRALTSGLVTNNLHPEEFQSHMNSLSQFLTLRPGDNRRSFMHPCFREWLTHGNVDDNQIGTYSSSKKFSVDPKRGHALLATLLSRQPPARLNEHAALELAHHLLKARMFRGQSKTTGINSNDLHAIWMAQCSEHLSESLVTGRNLFYPNIKVSKLLLHSGANPNTRTQVLCDAPVICAAAHIGCIEFVELLLNRGGDINLPATNGMTCLAYAAAAGHQSVVELLLRHRPRLDLVDRNGHSPLLHAISRGHYSIAIILLTCDLYVSPDQRKFSALQAFIAAATTGNIQLLQYLLDHPDSALHCDSNSIDPTRGESALTAAASRGKEAVCEFLVRDRRANIEQRNKEGMTPLLCAVKQGQWETVDLILNLGAAIEGTDSVGRTALVMAASVGHNGVVELLISRDANVNSMDEVGLTALGWASLKGHLHCVKSLIDRGSNIHHSDQYGRSPLDLAAFSGNEQVVDLLLNCGADVSNQGMSNMSPLERAINNRKVTVASILLKRGAPITDSVWNSAAEKPEAMMILIEKCVEDANILYREKKIHEAHDIYTTALFHLKDPVVCSEESNLNGNSPGPQDGLRDMTAALLLGLARCARKLSDLRTAELASTRALELRPHWYEALYVRARVRRENAHLSAALRDVEEAETNAPPHNKNEISRLHEIIQDEVNKCGNISSISETTENTLNVPGQRHNSISGPTRRPRVNSASSFNNNNNNGSGSLSPALSSAPGLSMARSYQPQSQLNAYPTSQTPRYHEHLPHLTPGLNELGGMKRNHSQDAIGDSTLNYNYHTPPVPYQHRVRPGVENGIATNFDHPSYPPQFISPGSSTVTHFNTTSRSVPIDPRFRNTGSQQGATPHRMTVATEL